MTKTKDPLAAVICPVVTGQINSYFRDHPETQRALQAAGLRSRVVSESIVKRIIGDLLCSDTRMRLAKALGGSDRRASTGGAGRITGAAAADVGATASAADLCGDPGDGPCEGCTCWKFTRAMCS